jgi:hypothetical protein
MEPAGGYRSSVMALRRLCCDQPPVHGQQDAARFAAHGVLCMIVPWMKYMD